MYYLRTKPAVGAIQFTVSAETLKEAKDANSAATSSAAAAMAAAALKPVVPLKANGVVTVKANGIENVTNGVGQLAVSGG